MNRTMVTLVALFLLVGTWSPMRILDSGVFSSSSVLLQPRLWIFYTLIIMSFLKPWKFPILNSPWETSGLSRDNHCYILILSVFLFYMIFSGLWSPDTSAAAWKAFDLGILLVVAAILSRIVKELPAPDVHLFFWGSLVFLVAILAAEGVLGFRHAKLGRMAALGGGSNAFGAMMTLGIFGTLHFINAKSLIVRKSAILAAFFFFLMVLLSGSRGSFISTVFALFCYLIINRQTRRGMPVFLLGLALAAILFSYTPLWDHAMETFRYRFMDLLLAKRYYSSRDDVFLAALKIGMDHWCIGAGLGSFQAITGWVYEHNIFLEVFAEGGLIGLILFLWLLIIFARSILRNREWLEAASISAAIAMFFYIQISGDLYDSRRFFIIAIIALTPSTRAVSARNNTCTVPQKAPKHL